MKGKKVLSIRTSYPQYSKDVGDMEYKEYNELLSNFFKFLLDSLIEGKELKFPSGLGSMKISGKKLEIKFNEKGEIEKINIDWPKTKKLWKECEECKKNNKKIYLLNEHSDGIRYRFLWSKHKAIFRTKRCYVFKAAKSARKKLFTSIINGGQYEIR